MRGHSVKRYRAYSFSVDEQDPIIPTLRRLVGNHRYSHVAKETGVSVQTLYNWFDKRTTRRPQFTTVMAVVRGMGYNMKIVRRRK